MSRPRGPARLRVAGVPVDPYKGVDARGDDYDPTEFYVRASNHHDHSDNRRMRLDPDITAQVERLIASGDLGGTPITSFNDFVRDAVVHGLHRIAGLVHDQHFTEAAADARRLARADTLVREQMQKAKIVTDCRDAFEGAQRARDKEVVLGLLELYEPMIERLRQPYAGQLEEVLKSAQRWLATNNK